MYWRRRKALSVRGTVLALGFPTRCRTCRHGPRNPRNPGLHNNHHSQRVAITRCRVDVAIGHEFKKQVLCKRNADFTIPIADLERRYSKALAPRHVVAVHADFSMTDPNYLVRAMNFVKTKTRSRFLLCMFGVLNVFAQLSFSGDSEKRCLTADDAGQAFLAML